MLIKNFKDINARTLKPHEWIFVISGGLIIFAAPFLAEFGFTAWLPTKIAYLAGLIFLLRT